MSKLLAELVEQRKAERISYQEYLKRISELAKEVLDPSLGEQYPPQINTPALQALYLMLNQSEEEALSVHAVGRNAPDGWRDNKRKLRRVKTNV